MNEEGAPEASDIRQRGVPPVPPASGLLHPDETPLMEYMRRRMEMMERELVKERERAQAAEALIKQQDALRGEVENQLRSLSDQYRQQKTLQQLEEDRAAYRGRTESLENRLDEMHKTWGSLLKDALAKPQQSLDSASSEVRTVSSGLAELRAELGELRKDLSSLREHLGPLPTLVPEVAELRAVIPTAARRAEEDERALREQLRDLTARVGEQLLDRLAGLESRLAQDMDRQESRLDAVARERAALAAAFQEQTQRTRQTQLENQGALEARLEAKIEGLREAFSKGLERQDSALQAFQGLREAISGLQDLAARPQTSKDEQLRSLEQERQDLMRALKERTEQLRAFTLERTEVERSLGESLMDLNRALETERAKSITAEHRAAELETSSAPDRALIGLLRKDIEEREGRARSLAEERDRLVAALAEEAAKVRDNAAERMRADSAWEAKVLEEQRQRSEERQALTRSEQAAADLRRQISALSEHLAGVLQDKQGSEAKSLHWEKERSELLAVLRRKEEMISMLSATFQNLLKKPS